MFFRKKIKYKNKKNGRLACRVQGMQREPGSMRARRPHGFILFLPPAASVSPLDRDKVTDLDLEKNANRIFPYFREKKSPGYLLFQVIQSRPGRIIRSERSRSPRRRGASALLPIEICSAMRTNPLAVFRAMEILRHGQKKLLPDVIRNDDFPVHCIFKMQTEFLRLQKQFHRSKTADTFGFQRDFRCPRHKQILSRHDGIQMIAYVSRCLDRRHRSGTKFQNIGGFRPLYGEPLFCDMCSIDLDHTICLSSILFIIPRQGQNICINPNAAPERGDCFSLPCLQTLYPPRAYDSFL